jgi:4-hydroxybenzoate polyprenyltransferase
MGGRTAGQEVARRSERRSDAPPEPTVAGAATGRAVAALVRPETARFPAAVHAAAATSAGLDGPTVVAGVVLVLAAYGAAAAYNDLHDVRVDAANRRADRPLVSGTATPATARATIAGCLAVVVAVQPWLLQPAGVLVTAAAAALAVVYSHPAVAVAGRGLAATTLLSACYVGLPVLLAGRTSLAALAALVLLGASQVLHKDARDEHGDRLHGKRTPVVRHGPRAVTRLAVAAVVTGATVGIVAVGPGWWVAAALGAATAEGHPARRWLLLAAVLGVAVRS